LRRKPKQLDVEPTLFAPASNGRGLVVQSGGTDSRRGGARRPGSPGSTEGTFTDDVAALVAPEGPGGHDAQTRAMAARIAARLAVRRPRAGQATRRGSGRLVALPYRGGSDDIDLDRTLEVLTERPVPEPEDIVVRERVRTRRNVVLLVDVSGSMRGERIRTAAATVGALAGELAGNQAGGQIEDRLGVIAFWSDAAVLLPLGQRVRPDRLLEDLLRLPARGLTNIAFPLTVARRQLTGTVPRESRVLLLSDCVHNAGEDPRPIAARLPRLDVLLDVTGEHDLDLAADLARAGHGRLRRIRTYREVSPALTSMFGT